MQCHHFDAHRCRSCSLLALPHAEQVDGKLAHVRALLDPVGRPEWLPPVVGAERAFRNKAKMVVAGTVEAPTLGILARDDRGVGGRGVDLRDCPLYSDRVHAALELLAGFVTTARLTPYDVPTRRGELKHLLVTEAPSGALMVRFVLRSTESLPRLRKHLPALLEAMADVGLRAELVSANLQPDHKAVLEGDDEVVLHGETLTMTVNGIDLHLRTRSFFQTNTEVAAQLYRQARSWVDELAADAREVWDLYCGVGGFALHLAAPGRRVVGVEVSPEAILSARASADERGVDGVEFLTEDAAAWAVRQDHAADLVVVNPPRRGIGTALADWLEHSSASWVLYSSCNAETLARDLASMPSWRPVRAQLLDMFPHTPHYEVLVLLRREGPGDKMPTDG
ncbi:23S rRNA (uracil(747)-C(5))-methyltransferase RlmC [Nocardioides sp. Y6]|uniref:23S rRNA (Uracil(747)-C(5))-methyltransferase RlmC n=2 Tax=Nocardioides malaquae TaxID=2773426 RepID=A0ABR9RUW4_9ACTN|nr:23S rRNA (uracil(747)-C(5))-methyltransferase RlmC [Nocardioides malaquae]